MKMNLTKTEIEEKLEQLAFDRTIPFCYHCYAHAPSGRCNKCLSDDLMRSLAGVGVEYGTDWVIKHILQEELTPVDLEESFEDFMRECYPEGTDIGFLKNYDTVSAIKELDPIAWRCAQSEWESSEEEEGIIISFGGGSIYYRTSDIVDLIQNY
jgi:hypothetical protein